METVIGLLIVVLPLALKLIGKVLEDASETSTPKQVYDAEGAEEPFELSGGLSKYKRIVDLKMAQGESGETGTPVADELSAEEQDQDKPMKRKKIDPKKLIVYSEIMKPKF